MDHFLHCLVEQIDPRLPKLALVQKRSCIILSPCTAITNGQRAFYFILDATYDQLLLAMTYLMAPLHSLVDSSGLELGVTKGKVLL